MEHSKNTIELQLENTALETENAALKTEIAELKALNQWYAEQFRLAQHRLYGASSEKAPLPDQISIFNEAEVSADKKAPEPELDQVITRTRRKKREGQREAFYEGIPTEQVVHELRESERVCAECGGALHACGHEVLRRELEIIPAQVRAVEHVQTVYACRTCDQESETMPFVKSDVPKAVIPGSGVASPSLLTYILCNKYVLALPLYRQAQEFERIGVTISRQTMANWMIYAASQWLKPIYDLLRAELIRNAILHADETTLQVIRELGRAAATKSYMWLYTTANESKRPIVLFEYQQTRSSSHPLRFLAGYDGYLQVDGFQGYHKLEPQGVTIVECWAHARRKFHETLKALTKSDRQGSDANTGYEFCSQLFTFENQYDELKLPPEERLRRRLLESKPIAEKFFQWALEISLKPFFRPKSMFGQAIGYALNQKEWLLNVYLDGRLSISNNHAENSIRPFTIGRKNWLFAFSPRDAQASSTAYSIVETAKANGLVPFLYLNYLFEQLPNTHADHFIDFLPWSENVQRICRVNSTRPPLASPSVAV
jgi:transposase